MAEKRTLGFGLEGKRVVITGAGGGIGQALVSTFSAAGAHIIACDTDAAMLDNLKDENVVERHIFNLMELPSIQAVVAAIEKPDVLINNAGWTRADVFSQVDDEASRVEMQLNFNGVVDLTRLLIPKMVANGGGSIVFISSVNGILHYGNPIYAAAKAGQLGFSRAIAVEYGSKGIRSNAVCPGSVRTAAWQHRIDSKPKIFEELVKHYPLGRIAEPCEVADTVAFLASPLASGITGVTLPVDAGLTAGNRRMIDDVIAP